MGKIQVESEEDLIRGITACSFESSTGKHEKFVELYCSLDSETVMIEHDKDHSSTPISFQICVEDKGLIVRTFRQLYKVLDYLKDNLTTEHRTENNDIEADSILVIYVHNLGFDSSFMLWDLLNRKDDWYDKNGRWLSNVFITPSNLIVSFRYKKTIEFRNSQALTGMSLDESVKELLGKNSPYRKLSCWDYTKVRCPRTSLSKDEQSYGLMDAYSIVEIIKSIAILHGKYDKYGNFICPLKIADIPSTKTTFVKMEMRKYLYKNAKSEKNLRPSSNSRMREMYDRALSIQFDSSNTGIHNLNMINAAYIGGLVDNNPIFSNIFIEDIGSFDITSQYPKQFLTKPFPCSKMEDINIKDLKLEDLIKMCEYKTEEDKRLGKRLGFIVKIILRGLRCKHPVPLFAISKEEAEGMVSCGRRVLYCEEIERTLVDADVINLINTYTIEDYKILECKVYNMSPVPEIFARYVLKSYSDKTKYKNDEEHKVTYNIRKIATNSITGIVSEYPLYDERDIDDQGQLFTHTLTEKEKLEQLNKNNNKFEKNSMCLYMWAPYITAYARQDLYDLMIPIGGDVICCDTDSIKFRNPKKYNKLFYESNKKNEMHLKECGWHWFGFTELQTTSLMMPYDINGEIHPIGNWENEGFNEKYGKLTGIITKRAKCYMLEYEKNNKKNYRYVVSGISPDKLSKYAKHVVDDKLFNIKDEKEFFLQDDIKIPKEWSGKLRVERFFNQKPFKYKDYQGNEWTMMNRTGTHLIPQDFSINNKEISNDLVFKYLSGIEPMDVDVGKFG